MSAVEPLNAHRVKFDDLFGKIDIVSKYFVVLSGQIL